MLARLSEETFEEIFPYLPQTFLRGLGAKINFSDLRGIKPLYRPNGTQMTPTDFSDRAWWRAVAYYEKRRIPYERTVGKEHPYGSPEDCPQEYLEEHGDPLPRGYYLLWIIISKKSRYGAPKQQIYESITYGVPSDFPKFNLGVLNHFETISPSDEVLSRENPTNRLIYYTFYGAVIISHKLTLKKLLKKYPLKRLSYLLAIYSGFSQAAIVPPWLYNYSQYRDLPEYLNLRGLEPFFKKLRNLLSPQDSETLFLGVFEVIYHQVEPLAYSLYPQDRSRVDKALKLTAAYFTRSVIISRTDPLLNKVFEWTSKISRPLTSKDIS